MLAWATCGPIEATTRWYMSFRDLRGEATRQHGTLRRFGRYFVTQSLDRVQGSLYLRSVVMMDGFEGHLGDGTLLLPILQAAGLPFGDIPCSSCRSATAGALSFGRVESERAFSDEYEADFVFELLDTVCFMIQRTEKLFEWNAGALASSYH